MLKLVGYEFRKILQKKTLLLFLVVVMCGGVASVFLQKLPGKSERDIYCEYRTDLEAEENQITFLNRQIDGFDFISYYRMNQEIMPEENLKLLISSLAEKNQSTYEAFVEEFSAYSEKEIALLRPVYYALLKQEQYRLSYEEYRKNLLEQADGMLQLNLLSGKNAFSRKNILKMMHTYEKMNHIAIMPDYDEGILAYGKNNYSFLLAVILMAAIASVIYCDEKESGAQQLLLTTAGGRAKTAAAKWISLMILGEVIAIILLSARILLIGKLCGYGDVQRTIQSVQYFRDCWIEISVAEYLLLSGALVCGAVFIAGTILSFLFSIFRKSWIPTVIFTASMAAGYLLYRLIDERSAYHLLKFLNLFSLSDYASRFSSYRNMNLLGQPVSVIPGDLVAGMILSAIVTVGYFLLYDGKIIARLGKYAAPKRKKRVSGYTSLVLHEIYRLVHPLRGGVILALAIVCVLYAGRSKEEGVNTETYMYMSYGTEIEGIVSHDRELWFSDKQNELDERENAAFQKLADAKGTDTYEIALASSQGEMYEIEQSRRAFERIREEYDNLLIVYDTGIPVHYISETRSDFVFQNENRILTIGMLLIAAVLVSVLPLISGDCHSGISRLVQSTLKGRGNLFAARYLTVIFYYLMMWCIVLIPTVVIWITRFGMCDFAAPIQSISQFMDMQGNMTILQFCLIWTLNGMFAGLVGLTASSVAGMYLRTNSTSLVVSSVLFVLDYLISLFGVPALSWLAFSGGLYLPFLLDQSNHGWICAGVLVKNGIILLLLLWCLYHLYQPTRTGRR